MICNACGGVIGRDCFNPMECQQITDNINYENARMANNYHKLEQRIAELEGALEDIDPYHPLIKDPSELYNMPDSEIKQTIINDDDLPF